MYVCANTRCTFLLKIMVISQPNFQNKAQLEKPCSKRKIVSGTAAMEMKIQPKIVSVQHHLHGCWLYVYKWPDIKLYCLS